MAPALRPRLLVAALLLGLVLPFLGKPVHVDDANFLVLARGAAADPWRPHALSVNWQGRTELAFDVLSNPPGIGWWLAPVAQAPVWAQHLAMLPWLLLAGWGAWSLGARFAGRPGAATLLVLGSPAGLLAAQALTPDLPLLALTLAGMAGLCAEGGPLARRWPWALLLGAASLFRYSGAVLIVVAALWPLLRHGRRGLSTAALLGTAAATPLLLLLVHDAHAYGRLHLLAMAGFQGVAETPRDWLRKLVASVAMLGGGVLLPVLCWARPQAALVGLVGGCLLGGFAASLSGQSGGAALATLAFASAGGAVLLAAVPPRAQVPTSDEDPRPVARWSAEELLLLAWAGLGLLFLLKLRFTATRYLLPFAPPLVLLALRQATPRTVQVAIPVTVGLAALLAVDDLGLARAQQALAARADALARAEGGPGLFAGHWGWQHHLEARGWRPLEEDAEIPRGVIFASSRAAWPQEPAESCLVPLDRLEAPGPWWLPRVHSWTGAANFHASMVSAAPPLETYAPWTLSADPYDVVMVHRGCRGQAPAPSAGEPVVPLEALLEQREREREAVRAQMEALDAEAREREAAARAAVEAARRAWEAGEGESEDTREEAGPQDR